MPRVIGIDPGTVSLDVCGLSGGRVDLDLTLPTEEALADPEGFVATLTAGGPPDLIAGPSGYGLPLTPNPARPAASADSAGSPACWGRPGFRSSSLRA